jgi:uncharacterized protein (DUF58 family)
MSDNSDPIREIKLKNKFFPFAVVLILIQQLIYPHKIWAILFVGLGGACLLGFFWARSLMKNISFHREMHYGWAKVGDHLRENFKLTNDSRLPAIWVTLLDYSNFPGYQVNTARYVEGQSVKRWIKGSVCYSRGYYNFGPTELETGDPFGLFSVRLYYPEKRSMLVTPPVIPLPAIEIATGDRIGEGSARAYAPEQTVTAAGVREYIPGDNLHAIHWLTSARRDDLFVRIFDQTPSSDWWIFLDMDEAVQIGEGQSATEEYSIILAASIANRGLWSGRAVGLIAHGDEHIWLPPQHGSGQRWEILHSLATIGRGDISLPTLLANTQRALGRSTSTIIITPSVDIEWLSGLAVLMQRDISVTVLLLDPQTFGGEGSTRPILSKLAAWGANAYRITPDIYELPMIHDYFIWHKTIQGRSSSRFTYSDLDWGKF